MAKATKKAVMIDNKASVATIKKNATSKKNATVTATKTVVSENKITSVSSFSNSNLNRKFMQNNIIWNIIHVFGYGESQVIGQRVRGKVANAKLANVQLLIKYLQTLQQPGTTISMETLFALNIYNNNFIDFLPKKIASVPENKSQRFQMKEIDTLHIEKLASEFISRFQ